ncbi:hypothetical protein CTI12_AA588060 [Artemisia annua]|uniref:Uncharacterized protein n=1 Tax=Artemisia annua TaxID=35608 RepID=A0A2U1KLL9_ARTAN|nr:hypothetical protein CTI12_AA588060 [Artemisia annua]
MSLFTVKMMSGSLPPVQVSNGSNVFKGQPAPTAASVKPSALPLQVRPKELQKLEVPEKTSMNVSRRDLALFLTAASFSAVTLSSPKPAEARMSRSEIKKMILDKFRILREKVGLSKPEPEEKEKIATPVPSKPEKKVPASPPPSLAEKKTHVPPEPPLPKIQNDKNIVVEAAPLP